MSNFTSIKSFLNDFRSFLCTQLLTEIDSLSQTQHDVTSFIEDLVIWNTDWRLHIAVLQSSFFLNRKRCKMIRLLNNIVLVNKMLLRVGLIRRCCDFIPIAQISTCIIRNWKQRFYNPFKFFCDSKCITRKEIDYKKFSRKILSTHILKY